jgi:hypothetical protein
MAIGILFRPQADELAPVEFDKWRGRRLHIKAERPSSDFDEAAKEIKHKPAKGRKRR